MMGFRKGSTPKSPRENNAKYSSYMYTCTSSTRKPITAIPSLHQGNRSCTQCFHVGHHWSYDGRRERQTCVVRFSRRFSIRCLFYGRACYQFSNETRGFSTWWWLFNEQYHTTVSSTHVGSNVWGFRQGSSGKEDSLAGNIIVYWLLKNMGKPPSELLLRLDTCTESE